MRPDHVQVGTGWYRFSYNPLCARPMSAILQTCTDLYNLYTGSDQ